MDALLFSTLAVAIAEIGDKTQLLAMMLAARYRKPWPIVGGIVVATVLNHALAGWLGAVVGAWIDPTWLRWLVVASFLAVALWALVPDELDEDGAPKASRFGPFVATTIAFFLVEIGDKTQVATVVLAARYDPLWQVIAGTTLGMVIANAPVVVLGAKFAAKLPLQAARWTAAAVFALLGLWVAIRGLPGAG